MSEEQAIDADALRRLYTTTPAEFVAARSAVAKQLRQTGDRDAAAAMAALRKPTPVDFALNVVATDHPDAIESFLAAAARVREAQTAATEGRGGGDSREALRELRAQMAEVVTLAGEVAAGAGLKASLTAPATARLGELVANPDAGEQLRAGHLGSGAVAAVDPFGGAGPGAPVTEARRATKATRPDPAPAKADRPSARDEARKRRLDEAVARAEERRADVQEDVDGAQARVAEAQEAVAAAEAELRDRQRALAQAGKERDGAAARLERADAAVAEARAALTRD